MEKKKRERCSKSKRPQNAVSTHRGDSWPARQPPCWRSADSCGSVPCALPANCAACSSGRSSCTCEASPLWKERELQVKSTATHLCYRHGIFATNPLSRWKDTSERLLKSQAFFPAPFSHHTHLLPPAGYLAPSVFHTNARYRQKPKEANSLVAKQTNRLQEGKANQTAESHPSAARVSPSLVGKRLLRCFAHGTSGCPRKNVLPQWPHSAPNREKPSRGTEGFFHWGNLAKITKGRFKKKNTEETTESNVGNGLRYTPGLSCHQ